jgi:GxxExxY protein
MEINQITDVIIGAAIEVHRHLGPGLLESAYQICLAREMTLRGLSYEREKELRITYKDVQLDCGYRLDFLVELKTVDYLLPTHEAQILTYLKLTGRKIGLLINFNVPILKNGLKRMAL